MADSICVVCDWLLPADKHDWLVRGVCERKFPLDYSDLTVTVQSWVNDCAIPGRKGPAMAAALMRYSVILTTWFWYESENIYKKGLFPKFQLIPILHFQVMHDLCCFIAPIDYCVEFSQNRRPDFLWNCSHFILKCLQPNSFREMCFLEKSYKKMHKIQILTILRAPYIQNQGECL